MKVLKIGCFDQQKEACQTQFLYQICFNEYHEARI